MIFQVMDQVAIPFFHRKILGLGAEFAGGFVPGGGLALDLLGGIGGGKKKRPIDTSSPQFSGTITHIRHGHGLGSHIGSGRFAKAAVAAAGPSVLFAPESAGCAVPGTRRDPRTGKCTFFLGIQSGVDPTPVGDAVMGRYGAAMVPGNRVIDSAVCLRGMVLGNDSLCYNKRDITNKERMWPKARAPLLTGGEMGAIAKAARAAGKLERTTKRLQKIGLMKTSRKPITLQQAKRVLHHAT